MGTAFDKQPEVFLQRVRLKDYRSIGRCDVSLRPFTILVGPNGAGKSNWLDALRFVSDALRNSLEYALCERGGIKDVRRRSRGHPRYFMIHLSTNLPDGSTAQYVFRIDGLSEGGFRVHREVCRIARGVLKEVFFDVQDGEVVAASPPLTAAVEPDSLYLSAVSGLAEFRPLYDALSRMGFYSFAPDRMRDLQDPSPSDVLLRDGRNIASILRRFSGPNAFLKERIEEYLGAVVPGLRGVDVRLLGPKETLEFRQEVSGDKEPWSFLAANMSDGTLRALGVLTALFQGLLETDRRVPLVGIEEPEIALHPGAATTLVAAISEATRRVQTVVTSHSPDLLDSSDIVSDNILAVASVKGVTYVGPVDEASRRALHDRLYTPGELLRLQQLEPGIPTRISCGEPPDLFSFKSRDD